MLPIFPKIILENDGHYILMAPVNGQPIWQLLALDSNGNFSYMNFPKIKTFNNDANTLLYNHKILISDWKYTYEIDTNGNVTNQIQYFNGTLNTYPIIQFNRACNDTNIVFCCGQILRTDTSTFANPLIFKSNNGNVQWSKFILGATEKNVFRNIYHCIIGNDGMLYSVLSEDSINSINGYISYKVIKSDTANGNLIWAKKYFETPYKVRDILPYDSVSFLLYGYLNDTSFIAQIDTSGNVVWCRNYYWGTAGILSVNKIIPCADGGFIATGSFGESSTSTGKMLLIKFDNQFNIEWSRKHFASSGYAYGRSIIQTKDGGYLICGGATLGNGAGDVYSYIIKTDSLGLSGCQEDTLTGITYITMSVTPVTMNYTTDTVSIYTIQTTAGDTMLGTYSEYDACIFLGVEQTATVKNNSLLLVYPNPATTILNMVLPPNQTAKQIELYDMQGRLVLQTKEVNQYPLQLNVAALTKGIYMLRVLCGANTFMAKVVVE